MKKNGFSLIELLVAMTVMAVLMAIGLVSYQGSRKAARDGKRKADLEQIRSALEIYRSDCKTYPTTDLPWSNPLVGGASCTNTYMSIVPIDPGSCTYDYSGTINSYTICASLENGSSVADSGCTGFNCGTGCICNYKVVNP